MEDRMKKILSKIYSVLHTLLALFAIYLSFKCNGGFDLIGLIGALIIPHIYIVYQIAMNGLSVCH
jgi:hypothetical protein